MGCKQSKTPTVKSTEAGPVAVDSDRKGVSMNPQEETQNTLSTTSSVGESASGSEKQVMKDVQMSDSAKRVGADDEDVGLDDIKLPEADMSTDQSSLSLQSSQNESVQGVQSTESSKPSGLIGPNEFAKKLWNAFDDLTIETIKEHDAQTNLKLKDGALQFLMLYDHHIERLEEFRSVWGGNSNTTVFTTSERGEPSSLSLDESVNVAASCIPALIEKHKSAKENVRTGVIDPITYGSKKYLMDIDLLVSQHQQLIEKFAIYNDECNAVEQQYQESCRRVDATIERRNKYANDENQEGRVKLKEKVDSALKFMISKESEYKDALSKYHKHQEDMQREISRLLIKFQLLKVKRTIDIKQIFQKLAEEVQKSAELLMEFSKVYASCSTKISTSVEINNIVHNHESQGSFETHLREFKSAESGVTSNQRKQYLQANNAYKHDVGKNGEKDFLNTMKIVESRQGDSTQSVGTEKISLKSLEANHPHLDAQLKWKSKHGNQTIASGKGKTNPFSNLGVAPKNMTSNSSNDGSRVPPSFKKPTFKKPSFKKPSGGKVPPTLGDEEAKNMPT